METLVSAEAIGTVREVWWDIRPHPDFGTVELRMCDGIPTLREVAAMAVLDACVRLLPGVMGKAISAEEESFTQGLLEYPHFTRPQEFEGRTIPEVLTSGDHAKVAAWRRSEAERLTKMRRPDLWARRPAEVRPEFPRKKGPPDG